MHHVRLIRCLFRLGNHAYGKLMSAQTLPPCTGTGTGHSTDLRARALVLARLLVRLALGRLELVALALGLLLLRQNTFFFTSSAWSMALRGRDPGWLKYMAPCMLQITSSLD